MQKIIGDKIVIGSDILQGCIYIEGENIEEVVLEGENDPFSAAAIDEELDLRGLYIAPGFIDIHTHGGGGYSFDGSEDDIVRAADFHLKHGTTTIYPTVSAEFMPSMRASVENIGRAKRSGAALARIGGAHMEGPYLSLAQTGAQGSQFIKKPDKDEYHALISELGDVIARVTYAPEEDDGAIFARYLAENGIVSSAGHTSATGEDMKMAKEAGCRLVTHLYSCTSTITRVGGFRRLGVIESAFLDDDIFVEIIADGKHLPPELIKLILKIKGCEKVVLVSDSLALAGTDVTHGFMQATEFIIEDGVCKLVDRSAFAGSIATADRLVRVMVKEVGTSIPDAVRMMSENPAKVMGLCDRGKLCRGMKADIVAFGDDINIARVMVGGKLYI